MECKGHPHNYRLLHCLKKRTAAICGRHSVSLESYWLSALSCLQTCILRKGPLIHFATLYGLKIFKRPIISFLQVRRTFSNPRRILLIALRMVIELFPVTTPMLVSLEIVPRPQRRLTVVLLDQDR